MIKRLTIKLILMGLVVLGLSELGDYFVWKQPAQVSFDEVGIAFAIAFIVTIAGWAMRKLEEIKAE